MKTKIEVLTTAWGTLNSWELWWSIGLGLAAAVAMAFSHVEIASPREPAPWVLGLVVAMLAGATVLWSDVANLLHREPLGEMVRARDPRLVEIGRPFTTVVGYLVAALIVAVVGYAFGDLLSRIQTTVFYGLGVTVGLLALLGFIDLWRLSRQIHGWNSELLAIRDESERSRRNQREA